MRASQNSNSFKVFKLRILLEVIFSNKEVTWQPPTHMYLFIARNNILVSGGYKLIVTVNNILASLMNLENTPIHVTSSIKQPKTTEIVKKGRNITLI